MSDIWLFQGPDAEVKESFSSGALKVIGDGKSLLSVKQIPEGKAQVAILCMHGDVIDRKVFDEDGKSKTIAGSVLFNDAGKFIKGEMSSTIDNILAIYNKVKPSHFEIYACHHGAFIHDIERHVDSFEIGTSFMMFSGAKHTLSQIIRDRNLSKQIESFSEDPAQDKALNFAKLIGRCPETVSFVKISKDVKTGEKKPIILKAGAPKHYDLVDNLTDFMGSVAQYSSENKDHQKANIVIIKGDKNIDGFESMLKSISGSLVTTSPLDQYFYKDGFLPIAASHGNTKFVKDYLDNYKSISIQRIEEAIYMAATEDNLKILELLCDYNFKSDNRRVKTYSSVAKDLNVYFCPNTFKFLLQRAIEAGEDLHELFDSQLNIIREENHVVLTTKFIDIITEERFIKHAVDNIVWNIENLKLIAEVIEINPTGKGLYNYLIDNDIKIEILSMHNTSYYVAERVNAYTALGYLDTKQQIMNLLLSSVICDPTSIWPMKFNTTKLINDSYDNDNLKDRIFVETYMGKFIRHDKFSDNHGFETRFLRLMNDIALVVPGNKIDQMTGRFEATMKMFGESYMYSSIYDSAKLSPELASICLDYLSLDTKGKSPKDFGIDNLDVSIKEKMQKVVLPIFEQTVDYEMKEYKYALVRDAIKYDKFEFANDLIKSKNDFIKVLGSFLSQEVSDKLVGYLTTKASEFYNSAPADSELIAKMISTTRCYDERIEKLLQDCAIDYRSSNSDIDNILSGEGADIAGESGLESAIVGSVATLIGDDAAVI